MPDGLPPRMPPRMPLRMRLALAWRILRGNVPVTVEPPPNRAQRRAAGRGKGRR